MYTYIYIYIERERDIERERCISMCETATPEICSDLQCEPPFGLFC